jgi:tape measure domain-containing protein
MPSIDDRIVNISFDNAKFQSAVADTIKSLQKLNDALAKSGATTGLADIDKAASKVTLSAPMNAISKLRGYLGQIGVSAGQGFSDIDKAGAKVQLTEPITALNKVQTAVADVGRNSPEAFNEIQKSGNSLDFSGLTSALDGVTSKFSVMSGAAAVALGNIYTKAAMAGANIAKALTIAPPAAGFKNYETQINAVQTILANTGLKGKAGLGKVNTALNDLNNYANLTVYNFSEMARNIGTFTAAGVDLKTATGSIKGIANLAAMSGSNSQQAGTAMYQLSQAISAGRVSLQDWNSVVNAGMGGQVFQKALMQTGRAMGTISDSAYKVDKATGKATINGETFRNSIMAKPGQQSWLTSKVLTTTLKNFTGDMKEADLVAQGFTKNQAKAIMAQAKVAVGAATNIKTATQLFDALKEEVASSWSAVWKTLFGDINHATKLFSALHTSIENALRRPIDRFNKVLKGWAKLGGRTSLINGLKQAFEDLMRILRPIQKAFRDVFPPKTSKDLLVMTRAFASLMARLAASPKTMENIQRTFRGLFSVLDIGKTIFFDVIKMVGKLLGVAGKGSGGLLAFTGSIGDFLTSLDKAITKGHVLTGFFTGLTAVIRVPIVLIKNLLGLVFGLFSDKNTKKVGGARAAFADLGHSLGVLKGPLDFVGRTVKKIAGFFGMLAGKIAPVANMLAAQFTAVLKDLGDAIAHADYNKIASIVQTGLLGAIFFALRKGITSGLGGIHLNAFAADLRSLNGVFHTLNGNLIAMQKSIQAATLLEIGAAVGVLAAGVFVFAKIDPKRLASAMTAVAVGLGELVGAMRLLTTGLGKYGFAQVPFIAGSIVVLAGAVVVLAAATKIFATMNWDQLSRGIAGVGSSLGVIGVVMDSINPAKLAAVAPMMVVMAVAVNLLAVAVKVFATMNWDQLSRGIGGLASAVGIIGVALDSVNPAKMAVIGPELIIMGVAVNMLAAAVKIFSTMNWDQLSRGVAGLASSIGVIGIALDAVDPKRLAVMGPELLIVGIATRILASAVTAFSKIPLGKMIVGVLGMGSALGVLSLALEEFPVTLIAQAIALNVLALALSALSAVVKAFGEMNVLTLVNGIVGMGGALIVLAAGLIMMEDSAMGGVALMAAAAALAVLAPTLGFLGTLKWGTILRGLVAIAGILAVLAVAGIYASGPIEALGAAMLPLAAAFTLGAAGVWLFAQGMALLGSRGAKGIGVFVGAATAAILLIPNLIINFTKGILETLAYAAKIAPQVAESISKIIDTFLNMVIKDAPKYGMAISAVLTQFLTIVQNNVPKLIAAGMSIMQAFLKGVANNIYQVTTNVVLIVTRFLNALTARAPDLVNAGISFLAAFIRGVAHKIGSLVGAVVGLVTRWIVAVASQSGRIATAGASAVGKFILGIVQHIGAMWHIGVRFVETILSGIASLAGDVIKRGVHIAGVFLHGFAHGLVTLADVAAKGLIDFLNGLADVVRHRSPEIRNAGLNLAGAIIDGLTLGIKDKIKHPIRTIKHGLGAVVHAAKGAVQSRSPSKVFHEIGVGIMQGLSNGIGASSRNAENAASLSGSRVIDSMQKTMTNVPGLLDGIMETDPTITPVLDLSQVKKDAGQLGDLTKTTPIQAAVSFGQATAISDQRAAADQAQTDTATATAPLVHYEQTINSPEPLSTLEIYRRTNNQLSQIRKEVGLQS